MNLREVISILLNKQNNMKYIYVIEKGVEEKTIKDFFDRTFKGNKIIQHDTLKNVYTIVMDDQQKCSIQITMPGTIKNEGTFDIVNGFPDTKNLEENIYDYCLDKTPDEFNIEEATVWAEPLEDKLISELNCGEKLQKFLKLLFLSDVISAKDYDHIMFAGMKGNILFDLSGDFTLSDQALNKFLIF